MATAKEPQLITGEPCAAGSKRAVPWILFEDLDGNGHYDHMTVGFCDGSVSHRGFSVMPADPWQHEPGDTAVGQLPPTAAPSDTIAFNSASVSSATGLWIWTATEYHQGTPVCSYSRTETGVITTTCPP